MKSASQLLVHEMIASYLHLDAALVSDKNPIDALGLEPLDLILLVLRLEDKNPLAGEFPIGALSHAKTIGDLVALVHSWTEADGQVTRVDERGGNELQSAAL
jgi:hypothetical protein